MTSEYFASLHYIWLHIVFFIFSLFLFAVCLYACLFVRWVYKRRLRQKTDAMISCYKNGDDKKKEMELKIKRKELHPEPEKKKTRKSRKVHIVSKPTNEVIQKTETEYIVRQVNEAANDEVACSPGRVPPPPPQPTGQQQQFTGDQLQQLQTQFVMVPVEMFKNQLTIIRENQAPAAPVAYPASKNKLMIVESVATQTSDRAVNVLHLEKSLSDDWLAGYDERDGEREEDRIDIDEEECESDKVMKKRNEAIHKDKKDTMPGQDKGALGASDETRVSLEDFVPSSAPASTATPSSDSSNPPTKSSDSTSSSDSSSTDSAANEKRPEKRAPSPKKEQIKVPKEDPVLVKSNYLFAPNADPNAQIAGPQSAQKQSVPNEDSKLGKSSYLLAPNTGTQVVEPQPAQKQSAPEEGPKMGKSKYLFPENTGPSCQMIEPKPAQKQSVSGEDEKLRKSNYLFPDNAAQSSIMVEPKSSAKKSPPASRPSVFPYFIDSRAPEAVMTTGKSVAKITNPRSTLEHSDSSCALYRGKSKSKTSSQKIYNGASNTSSK